MKRIEEYIFYRVYIAYKKKDDIPLFSSVMYIIAIYMALSLFICGTFANLFKNQEFPYDKSVFIIWYSFIIIRILKKYYNKNIRNKVLMENSIKNKVFPNWFYFFITSIKYSIRNYIIYFLLCIYH